jgi:flagellar basal-body rod modification protein FlgD
VSISAGATNGSNDIRGNYMTLLVTQLQNQNPLEPMSSDDMTAQLTQLSQLEHLENMNTTFEKALFAAEVNQASGIIDKQVSFLPDSNGGEVAGGKVDGVTMTDGKVMVSVGGQGIELDRILTIGK